MDRTILTHLPAVLAVARTRSFVKAGAELGLGASAVSHAIRLVEDRIGAPLFARTTRSVALTEAGAMFVEAAKLATHELDNVVASVKLGQAQVSGLLRINVPHIALDLGLTSILAEMTRRHPQLTVEVISDNALTDIVAHGFDAGVRLGEMIAQDMVAVRLTPPLKAVTVASPTYLANSGALARLEDLQQHNCIEYRMLASGSVYSWDLQQEGIEVRLPVKGTVRVSDASHAVRLALSGLGIAYVFKQLVAKELATGQLIEVLPQASIEEPGLFLYFPRRAAGAAKLRAFLDVIKDVTLTKSRLR